MSEWLKVKKLSLNVVKSKCMVFHHPLKKIPTLLLKINDIHIECVNNFDFLGLTINKYLNWKKHTNRIAGKISRIIGVIRKF